LLRALEREWTHLRLAPWDLALVTWLPALACALVLWIFATGLAAIVWLVVARGWAIEGSVAAIALGEVLMIFAYLAVAAAAAGLRRWLGTAYHEG